MQTFGTFCEPAAESWETGSGQTLCSVSCSLDVVRTYAPANVVLCSCCAGGLKVALARSLAEGFRHDLNCPDLARSVDRRQPE